jgi:hypothetical protein
MTSGDIAMMWRQRIEAQKSSGLNKITWCSKNNINIKNFYRWNAKLQKRGNDVDGENDSQRRFVLAKAVIETADGISIKIGKACINVTRGFDTETLSDVLRVVNHIC